MNEISNIRLLMLMLTFAAAVLNLAQRNWPATFGWFVALLAHLQLASEEAP